MPSGLAIAMLSVSHNAQSRPASKDNRSTVANSKRAAPVIRVASKGWKKEPGFSTFPGFAALAEPSGKPSSPPPKQASLCLGPASSTINSTKMP